MHGIAPAVLCVMLYVSLATAGAQLVVSRDGAGGYRSIQGAIDAASFGDTVYVNPGVYEERVTFKHGISLIGAGATVTIIRHGYGAEEALLVHHASAGRIEGFTIERGAAPLPAPAVVFDEASVLVRDCILRGGSTAAVDVVGSTSRLTLERVWITGTAGHGLRVSGGAVLRLEECEIRDVGGNGVLCEDATLDLVACTIEGNGLHGLAVGGTGRVSLVGGRLDAQSGWAILAAGSSTLDARGAALRRNREGAVRLTGASAATLIRLMIGDGGGGIELRDTARAEIESVRIEAGSGDGLLVLDAATATVRRSEIVAVRGDGIVLASSAPCIVENCTVVSSGGDGVRIEGPSIVLRHTAVARNTGAGLRVRSVTETPAQRLLGYNAVWGNGEDYVGTSRRPSDIAAPPEFAALDTGNLSLREDSPLIGAGQFGITIGARPASGETPGAAGDLVVRWSGTISGLGIAIRLRSATDPPRWETVNASASFAAGLLRATLDTDLAGTWGGRLRGDASAGFSTEIGRPTDARFGALAVDGRIEGVLGGDGSWIAAVGTGRLTLPVAELSASLRVEAPSGVSRQTARLRVGSDWSIGAEVEATDLVPDCLAFLASIEAVNGSIDARFQVSPQPVLRIAGETTDPTGAWSGTLVSYLDPDGPWEGRLSFADGGGRLRLAATVRVDSSGLRRAALDISGAMQIVDIAAGLALLPTGVRLELRVAADVSSWFAQRERVPPTARFVHRPHEPEAGESIEFDASGAFDPEGQLVEFHWAFGDGERASGSSVRHTYRQAGTYEVVLVVVNDRGATATADATVHVWPPNTAPVAVFLWTAVTDAGTRLPRPVRAGDRILLDATDSHDRDGRIVEYAWDFDSDGAFDLVTDRASMVIEPLEVGSHPVTLRVIDDTGRASAVMRVITVAQQSPPIAAFEFVPATPSILDPVRFIDRSVDLDGTIAAWRWEFGDGRAASEPEPVHRYAGEGRYEVTLRVVDSDGLEATARHTLEVTRVPEVVPVDGVWALLIGIANYPEFPDLDFARNDAEGMARWMFSSGVPAERIRLLTDRSGAIAGAPGLSSEVATLVAVRDGLGWLRRTAGRDDLVWIHFSGHGYQGVDDDGDEEDGVDEFFVLHDTRAGAVEDTALRDDEFGRFLDRLASQHVLVTFDSCYSGGLSRSLPGGRRPIIGPADLFGDLSLEGRLILSASGESQAAYESTVLEHGVFTYYLLDGLSGAADRNGDGRVTAWELYEHVAEAVPLRVAAERGAVQEPQLIGRGETRVVLAAPPPPPIAGISFSPAVPFAGGIVFFRDETLAEREIVARTWDFGDGTTVASLAEAAHVYDATGVYEVRLRVLDSVGLSDETSLSVPIAAAGRVEAIVDSGQRVVLSLGAQHGIEPGDRFVTGAWEPDGQVTGVVLEIVEIAGGDESIARVVDETGPIDVGLTVRPIERTP